MIEKTLYQLLKEKKRTGMATIINRQGSAPRIAGSKMLVLEDQRIFGTIGGGLAEATVIHSLLKRQNAEIRFISLTGEDVNQMDMICGGNLDVLIEWIQPSEENIELYHQLIALTDSNQECALVSRMPRANENPIHIDRCLVVNSEQITGADIIPKQHLDKILLEQTNMPHPYTLSLDESLYYIEPYYPRKQIYIFGAGHVAQYIAMFAKMLDFKTVVFDDRKEFANRERFPTSDEVHVLTSIEAALENRVVNENDYLVIVTRGHVHDAYLLEKSLKTKAGYIGMIGSRRKKKLIFSNLSKKGFSEEALSRVHSPIGLPISAETPQEIAISIMAELIQHRVRM